MTGIRARAQTLLGQVPLDANPMIGDLALALASQAHKARASSTVAQYKEPWQEFLDWAELLHIRASDIYDIRPEIVAMYLMHVYQTVQADEVGPGRVAGASATIACHFFLAGRPSPTEHPACNLVRDLGRRTLQGKKLHRESMQPEHVRMLAAHFAGPDASLPDLMMVAAISVMFAGFLRFNDLAHISVKSDLLTLHDTHMAITLPRSKTDQEGKGQTIRIARVGGVACPFPRGGCGPLLRRVKATQQGHQLQQRTGSVQSPIPSLSYTSFREKLAAMCSAVGIKRGIMPHSMRIGGNSAAAARGVSEEARKAHGRWKTDAMVQLYTRLEDDAALETTRNLGLA
ncbi:hypothetical protein VOLCADRAFT_106548 [Volvox carteri f. nagariensis]|uniref:Tyr recombinase domain-containing protein n=1 Tax=Volvox carteri f. nagariensis TaxID=3068 RepID=D8U837_VOLCA|nr:uncharacterized protein VOLCADRAFT_106548 [Volvox carteri f. nagariensis]EFJ44018.1 hypothetical protein VOLCADRAFT_106548 [Volvox carteri f. nagariensis]|eukprot:XP_002954819.1 hypothetical protein VOLCADRAFT_106548 [Volvox carteri f. nagariensis]